MISKREKQTGASLLEVMISFFILGAGLLGVFAMQTQSMHYNQQAFAYSQAIYLANNMIENIRSNSRHAQHYAFEKYSAPNVAINCQHITVNCSVEQLIDWEVAQWVNEVHKHLPDGKASIALNDDQLTVTITFNTLKLKDHNLRGKTKKMPKKREQYVLTTRI